MSNDQPTMSMSGDQHFNPERCFWHEKQMKAFQDSMTDFMKRLDGISTSVNEVKDVVTEIKINAARENSDLHAQIKTLETKVDNFNKPNVFISDIFKTVITTIITAAIMGGLAFSFLKHL